MAFPGGGWRHTGLASGDCKRYVVDWYGVVSVYSYLSASGEGKVHILQSISKRWLVAPPGPFSGVGVAQSVEHWIVVPVVVGSSPIAHPPAGM